MNGPAGAVTVLDLESLVRQQVPPSRYVEFWSRHDLVRDWAQNLYGQQALAQEAIKEGLDRTPESALKLKFARDQVLADLLRDARAKASAPDDKAVRAYARDEMRGNPDRFKTPEEIDVRHILLPVAKDGGDDVAVKAKAEKLLAQLRKGANFATLAKENSKDPGSAAQGGDLGFFPRGRMVPAFEEAAFSLKKPGDLVGPVRSPFGYHIIELVARKPAGQMSLKEVEQKVRDELTEKRKANARKALLDQVQEQAKVNQPNLDALVTQQAALHPLSSSQPLK
ncbi:MAG: peptidylprolyl isomerase [Burkholderiaceae bacterium]|nr:peptidylprolyl isomerase [Burkholderiaceae bacterium]